MTTLIQPRSELANLLAYIHRSKTDREVAADAFTLEMMSYSEMRVAEKSGIIGGAPQLAESILREAMGVYLASPEQAVRTCAMLAGLPQGEMPETTQHALDEMKDIMVAVAARYRADVLLDVI